MKITREGIVTISDPDAKVMIMDFEIDSEGASPEEAQSWLLLTVLQRLALGIIRLTTDRPQVQYTTSLSKGSKPS